MYAMSQDISNQIIFGKDLSKATTNKNKTMATKKSGIQIKESHKGRFTAIKKKTGKTTEQLKHSKSPAVRKMATFAANAAKWKHKGK
jgi:hypothetical protein